MLKLEPTNHSYFCAESNCFVEGPDFGLLEAETVKELKFDYGIMVEGEDDDYNLLFRYDLEQGENGNYMLKLFYVHQRKGNFLPVRVMNVTEEDLEEINAYLKRKWKHMEYLWCEFSRVRRLKNGTVY